MNITQQIPYEPYRGGYRGMLATDQLHRLWFNSFYTPAEHCAGYFK